MRNPGQERPALYALIAGIAALVFTIDLFTALGIAESVLYFVPLTLSLFASRAWVPPAVGLGCTTLVGVGYLASPPATEAELGFIAAINRSLVSASLIALGFVGQRFVAGQLRLGAEDWIKAGIAGLVPRLQGEQDVPTLARQVLTYLGEYLGAQVGSVYVMTTPGTLTRAGGLALEPEGDEGSAPVVRLGETLIGETAAGARLRVIEDVPDGYLRVRSGVGSARPRALVLAPMQADGWINGVLELGFFTPPPAAARELLEEAAGVIGVALRSAEYRRRQADLLAETQRQAAELQTQQDELQAANAELEEQTTALGAANSRLQTQQAELEESNAQLEEQTRILEEQKERLSTTQLVLQRKAAELERASQYKSEFLANMSHELRTPLNSALILARLLADNRQGNLTPEQVQYAANIQKAGNDLLQLINDILDLAKIESGKLELEVAPVEIAELFALLEQRFAPLASEKKLALLATLEPGCPQRIETDALRLQQILSNLLSNAVKFTAQGAIRLRAERGPADDVLFTVQDTGIGIAPHQHEVIFEAFRQADGTTNRKYGGTGLGLSICRELADHLGGSIRLRSAEGQGSTFLLQLPLRHRGAAAAPAPSAPARPAVPSGERAGRSIVRVEDDRGALDGARVVLVVEDDPVFAAILRELAHELDFRCVIAPTADEGLRMVREIQPLAVLLDIGLPDHSGFAVLESLKRDPATRHIPVHVLSASDDRQVAREMGVVGYVLKPVQRDELVAVFRRLEAHIARRPRTVLVVEDDPVQREAIAKLLDTGGVDITPVATAAQAFAKLRETTFDCVVLDLMLPETSGFELLDWMAGDAGSSFPPVIVYTARALTVAEEQRLRQHARSVIIKGARSPERLLEEVTLFLHQVEADLPEEKRQMLRAALDREAVFVGRRILIVEDDVRNIFALTSALEPKGAAIEIARNGKEALLRIESEPPVDMVLMDLMMPEMDGLTAIREIRKDARRAELPIIALTAKAMPDDRQQSLAAGANDYIAKPIDLEKLVSLIRVWMPRG